MNSAGRSNISSIFQHGLQDSYLSLNPHVKGGLFPLKEITHLRHIFENIVNNFHNRYSFSFSFQKHLLFPKLIHEFRKITESKEASLSEPYSTAWRQPITFKLLRADWPPPRNRRSDTGRATTFQLRWLRIPLL